MLNVYDWCGDLEKLDTKHIKFYDRRYVYHIGSEKYKDIRPLYLSSTDEQLAEIMKRHDGVDLYYINEVNCFLSPITKQHIEDLRKGAFISWGVGSIYMYKIDLLTNKKAIKYIHMMSIPEQNAYHNEHWDNFYADAKDYSKKDFKIAKKEYMLRGSKSTGLNFFNDKLSIYEYMHIDNDAMKNWQEIDKFVKYNIVHGRRTQYATHIPHVQIYVGEPLIISETIRLI